MTSKNKGADHAAKETAREYAKNNLKEVKNVQEKFLDAMDKAQTSMMQSAGLHANNDVAELNTKAMDFLKNNLSSGFELAEKLVDATDVTEAVEIQNEFVRKQLENYTEQAQEFSDLLINSTHKNSDN